MSRRDDDLSPFRDDPVFRALTAPGTADELSGEAELLATFRAVNAVRPSRRFAARVGASGAVAVVAVALSGSVAAAYTSVLPAPLQRIAHDAAGPIGVPAPQHHHHTRSVAPQVAIAPAPAPIAASPQASAGAGVGGPRSHSTPTTVPSSPTSMPDATPTAPVVVTTPSMTPTPAQGGDASLTGATLTLTSSASEVPVGSSVTVAGQLDASDATPIADRRVALFERLASETSWTRVGLSVTGANGSVSFGTPVLGQNARFVLRSEGSVHSGIARVVIEPKINFVVAPSATDPSQETVTVTVAGGQQGDVVELNRHGGKRQRQQVVLDQTGTAAFTIEAPQHRAVSYRLFVPRTKAHGVTAAQFSVSPA